MTGYIDTEYKGNPFHRLNKSGLQIECTYDRITFEPVDFFINRRRITQEDLLADLFWDYDTEAYRGIIRDHSLDEAFGLEPEPVTFKDTGCVRSFK